MRPAYEPGTEPEYDDYEPRGVRADEGPGQGRSANPTGSHAADG